MKTIFLFERGINGWQGIFGDWNNWPNLATAWIHNQTDDTCAQSMVYFTTPMTAAFTRTHRACEFAKMAEHYRGWEINIAAHSEGTATVLESLRRPDFPPVNNLHLLCGACDGNFIRNGLNVALRKKKIRNVFIKVADRDLAMRIENTPLGLLLFKVPFRDRSLGLKGPDWPSVDPVIRDRVHVDHWPTFGHSECFEPHYFNATMSQLVNQN